MSTGPLHRIRIEGLTSIGSATVDLTRLNVLVGANGSGKSNFIQALAMLGRIVDGDPGWYVGLSGGASALIADGESAKRIRLEVDTEAGSYEVVLAPAPNDELVFDRERISIRGKEVARLGRGYRETRLHELTHTSDSGSARQVVELLRGCRVYHFHDTSADAPVKRRVSAADNLALRPDAENLAAFLLRLQLSDVGADRAAYRRIVGAIRLVAPFFRDFILQPEADDWIRLRWQQQGSDAMFFADQMSDGTLRFACLAALLLQPTLPPLVVLDEPELGLHPFAIVQLADLLRAATARSQVLIATQSVTLMNQFELDDLVIVERRDGVSEFSRLTAESLRDRLEDYSPGELWEKNLLGGRPAKEEPGRA